ncbi:MAG: bifunctional (p)ppGpp synthetase/guanosine-3',5'-bis(diphosphate) 3'-pyrophosphohydrolase [Erysipelotrichaceae bacterium]|nr:bifunctional (p)ppGpp synthetase/guanosine-3',5'-bis(diphosphate) 3'-pyrophosphohydrolase [Erysipelotrichaceae bacterium]
MINEAIKFASLAHMGMRRKGNDQPYIFHPLEVMSLVSLMTLDEEILCAAILHDTVEDTDVSIEDIKENFGERVASLVGYESEDKRGNVNKSATWKKRKEETIERISSLDDEGAKMVCLADKVSNLRSIHLGLLDKGEEFWQSFNQKDPKEHCWYYTKLKEALVSLKDYAVYKEFCFLIDTIFKNMGEENE